MSQRIPELTAEYIDSYVRHLCERECASQTIQKYRATLNALMKWLDGRPFTKGNLLEWKEELVESHAAATVNAALAAVNGYLIFWQWDGMRLRPLRLQRALFYSEDKELTKSEYARLVNTAQKQGNQRLSLVIQTICATGIRVKGSGARCFCPTSCGVCSKIISNSKKSPPERCLFPAAESRWTDPISGGI